MILTTIAALLAAAPTTEAEALGLRLARAGTLATLLPMTARSETEELVKAAPALTPAEQDRLRAIAAETARAGAERIATAMGHAYAERLTLPELRTLVAAAEAPAQRRFRAILPEVMAQAMTTAGGLDFKREVRAAFCRDTGKWCEQL